MSHGWGFNSLPGVFSRTPNVAWVGVQFVTWCFSRVTVYYTDVFDVSQ